MFECLNVCIIGWLYVWMIECLDDWMIECSIIVVSSIMTITIIGVDDYG